MTKLIFMMAALLMVLSSPVAAQETSSPDDLRAAIEDLRDGTIDEVAAAKKWIDRVRKQKSKTRKKFERLGRLENIIFWETYERHDLYLVSFEFGRVVYSMNRNNDGEIQSLGYRTIRISR